MGDAPALLGYWCDFARTIRCALAQPLHPGGAWALVGASVGLLIGIASVSLRRAVATVTGGAIGGFVGGFLFDFIAFDSASEALAHLSA